MSTSSPSTTSSFDPALHLHSEVDLPQPRLVTSNSDSDDLEALHIQEQQLKNAKIEAGVVIQHRSWKLPGTLRIEDVFNSETPSKHTVAGNRSPSGCGKSASAERMPFSSSPILYPQSSSPPIAGQKRKLFQSWKPEEPKKRKMLGGFILDEDDEEVALTAPFNHQTSAVPESETLPRSLAAKESGLDLEQGPTRPRSPSLPPLPQPRIQNLIRHNIPIQTCSGKFFNICLRTKSTQLSYEQTIAQRSINATGGAKKAYYGVDIHKLLDENNNATELDAARRPQRSEDTPLDSIEPLVDEAGTGRNAKHQMWTEKYRARKFTDLIGDERTHRSVLRWLKSWDPIVFPGSTKSTIKKKNHFANPKVHDENPQHRKILLLTGPPGLGKTTLAHVIAKQAGYETLEINASDERSRDVVKGRIRDAVGTENVRGIDVVRGDKKTRKAGRPVCVIVDEVDGVVSGSSGTGGEGGFMKALIDLVQLDQQNSQPIGDTSFAPKKTKKGDKFRLLRPLILVCNDLYAPALRPLRTSSCAEIIHVRKPPLEKAISRLTSIFHQEGIPSDGDAVRRLCEASWGIGSRKQNHSSGGGAGEGDIRGVLVQAEWIAHKLRSSTSNHSQAPRLTKTWVEENVLNSDTHLSRGLGRGGVREIIQRVFIEGAGLPNLPTKISAEDARLCAESKTVPVGISDLRKRAAITSIREMADTLGDHDRLMTDCFSSYPSQVYQDDTYLSKPVTAYDWLHFHDLLSSRVFGGQEWELNPYLSQSVCAFHHLFAAVSKERVGWDVDHTTAADREAEADSHPFAGPRADFAAYEAEKATRSIITEFQSSFSAPLLRLYRSTDAIAVELIPNVTRMLAPDVKPVVVGGSAGQGSLASVRKASEKNCVSIASRVMNGMNISFEKVRIEIEGGGAHSHAGFALRMEPPLDTLATFHSTKPTTAAGLPAPPPVRYAIRQVLDQEHRNEVLRLRSASRLARTTDRDPLHLPTGLPSPTGPDVNKENSHNKTRDKHPIPSTTGGPRDFFGRLLVNDVRPGSGSGFATAGKGKGKGKGSIGTESQGRVGKALQAAEERVWVSFHEGYSNAVRKPVGLREFLDSF